MQFDVLWRPFQSLCKSPERCRIEVPGRKLITWPERSRTMEELKTIMQKFVASGWDLIAIPAQQWLDGNSDKESLISAIKQADEECGSCGCELDPLYKRALELL